MANHAPMAGSQPGGFRASSPMAAAIQGMRRPVARRSLLGLFCFALLALICLLDLNAVGATLLGVNQMFSYLILALCAVLLILYRLTVYRDLGRPGRIWFLFMSALLLIGAPIGLGGDATEIYLRWFEVRTLLSAALIVAATAVATRHIYISYGPRLTLTIVFFLTSLIPMWVLVSAKYPAIFAGEGAKVSLERSVGTYANPNAAGAAACIALAVAFSALFVKRTRVVALVVLAACAVAVVLTFSRSAVLMLVILSVAQFFISPGISRVAMLLVGGAIAGGAILFILQAATSSGGGPQTDQSRRLDHLARIFHGDVSHETTGGRGQLAMLGIQAWLESPILGSGLGSQLYVNKYSLGSHNTYIKILGEAGVVPAALFLGMMVSFFLAGWRCTTPAVRTLVCGYVLVLAMACLVSHGVLVDREHNIMMGICFGLLTACAEMAPPKLARKTYRRQILPPRTRAMITT